MALRGEGHDNGSDDRSGTGPAGARSIDCRRHQRQNSPIPRPAKSRPSPSNVQKPGAYARRNCPSVRTGPAICLPRCSHPRAFWDQTRRMRLRRRLRHLRRAGAHRYRRHRGNAHRRERRTARPSKAPVRCSCGALIVGTKEHFSSLADPCWRSRQSPEGAHLASRLRFQFCIRFRAAWPRRGSVPANSRWMLARWRTT